MMASLNEYCIHHINEFLKPHDWIHVSRVCKLWEQATLRNWKRIAEIIYYGYIDPKNVDEDDEPIVISAVDAGKIVLCAAPFVTYLQTYRDNRPEETMMMEEMHDIAFNFYYYRVANFKVKNILKLLSRKATNLAEVCLCTPPEASLVRPLFETNNIIKLKVDDPNVGWYRNIPTHGIEEFHVAFDNANADMVSFQGLFKNLKKLMLDITYDPSNEDPSDMLAQILPFVPGLKSFSLYICSKYGNSVGSYTLFTEVTRLSELEELSIELYFYSRFKYPELFLKRLPSYLPKLRKLKLRGCITANGESLQKILSLPQLETLEFELEEEFPRIELPDNEHLSKLRVTMESENPVIIGIFGALKKMRRLQKLEFEFRVPVSQERLLDLVYGVVNVATYMGRDVLLKPLYRRYQKLLRITKLTDNEAAAIFEKDTQVLQLLFRHENQEALFEKVKEFVRNNVHSYNALVLD